MNQHSVSNNTNTSSDDSLRNASLASSRQGPIRIPAEECEITFAHSGGPGGQNVNKVESKAVLKWYPELSDQLSPRELEKIVRAARPRVQEAREGTPEDQILSDEEFRELSPAMIRLRSRINKEGAVVLQDSTTRDQHKNKSNVIKRLETMLTEALKDKPERKKKQRSKSTLRKERDEREKLSKKRKERNKNKNLDY